MARLTAIQIATHAAAAGFRGADLQTSVAVALAESGGNPAAHNLSSREDSRGLWQINVRAHPELAGNLFDPATNARAARAVLRKQGWRAWSVFTNGKFVLYMPTAGVAVRSLPGGIDTGDPVGDAAAGAVDSTVGAVVDAGKAVLSIADLMARAGTWISNPQNWLRVAYIALGGALLIGALVVVAAPMASNVIPAGKVVKTAKKLTS
jgi:Lysozyme like domain